MIKVCNQSTKILVKGKQYNVDYIDEIYSNVSTLDNQYLGLFNYTLFLTREQWREQQLYNLGIIPLSEYVELQINKL